MDKEQKHPSAPQPESTGNNHSLREQQAGQIIQQLVAEGIFTPNETVEITFPDARFIYTPDNDKTAE